MVTSACQPPPIRPAFVTSGERRGTKTHAPKLSANERASIAGSSFPRSPQYSQSLTGCAARGGGQEGGGQADQSLQPHDGVAAIRPGARVGDVQVVSTSLGGVLRIANFDKLPERGIGSLHDKDKKFRESRGGCVERESGVGSQSEVENWDEAENWGVFCQDLRWNLTLKAPPLSTSKAGLSVEVMLPEESG